MLKEWTFVEYSKKGLLKLNKKKDGLARILPIFAGGREGNNIDIKPLFILIISQIVSPMSSLQKQQGAHHVCFYVPERVKRAIAVCIENWTE